MRGKCQAADLIRAAAAAPRPLAWYQPRGPMPERLCSSSSSVPPGRRQAAMLRIAAAGSGNTHRLKVSTTAHGEGWGSATESGGRLRQLGRPDQGAHKCCDLYLSDLLHACRTALRAQLWYQPPGHPPVSKVRPSSASPSAATSACARRSGTASPRRRASARAAARASMPPLRSTPVKDVSAEGW